MSQNIKDGPLLSLSHVIGHDADGYGGRMSVADITLRDTVALFRAASLKGRVAEVAMASPPTVGAPIIGNYSANTTGGAIGGGGHTVAVNDPRVTAIGCEPVYQGSGSYYLRTVDVAGSTNWGHPGAGFQFVTSSRYVDLGVRGVTNVWRVAVWSGAQWEYVTINNAAYGTTSTGYRCIPLDFGADDLKGRLIRWESGRGDLPCGVAIAPNHFIQAAPVAGPRLVILGDSFPEGTGSTAQDAAGQLRSTFPWQFARRIGVEQCYVSGWGGTGFLNNASTKKTFYERIDDITRHNPDGVVIFGGQNDGTYAAAALQAAATQFFEALREALPDKVIGYWGPQRCPSPYTVPSDRAAAIAAGVDAVGSIYRRDIYTTGANAPYMSGDTYNLTGTQDGLNYWFIGADGVHQNQDGHDNYASRMAADWQSCLDFHAALAA